MADVRKRHRSGGTSDREQVKFYLPRRNSELKLRHVDPSYEPKLLKAYNVSVDSEDIEFEASNESRILVLYTGGTIGMRVHGGGMDLGLHLLKLCTVLIKLVWWCLS